MSTGADANTKKVPQGSTTQGGTRESAAPFGTATTGTNTASYSSIDGHGAESYVRQTPGDGNPSGWSADAAPTAPYSEHSFDASAFGRGTLTMGKLCECEDPNCVISEIDKSYNSGDPGQMSQARADLQRYLMEKQDQKWAKLDFAMFLGSLATIAREHPSGFYQ
ncbi:uncharacterized protein I303_100922 [Kwoniella dejecticola CBS 10117]|uniref:Uncharacterized protein n=1 Tax=Kwoniella dejecticola CBS 10117 TaxID=1296121 RepID=A0A1A6AGB5_9TREE|nr:uncharacterized protein I303_00926 [Kwoniella dejecticola CBS 10117]OBR89104.1 hypothetical protein I303_00926 [Kwoniella dejecticola CBS 10117]